MYMPVIFHALLALFVTYTQTKTCGYLTYVIVQ